MMYLDENNKWKKRKPVMMQLFIDYQLNDCTLSKMQTLRAKTQGNSGQKESLASNTV